MLWYIDTVGRCPVAGDADSSMYAIILIAALVSAAQLLRAILEGSSVVRRFAIAYRFQQKLVSQMYSAPVDRLHGKDGTQPNGADLQAQMSSVNLRYGVVHGSLMSESSGLELPVTPQPIPAGGAEVSLGGRIDNTPASVLLASTGTGTPSVSAMSKGSGHPHALKDSNPSVAMSQLNESPISPTLLRLVDLLQLVRGWDALTFVCEALLLTYCVSLLSSASAGTGLDFAERGWQLPLAGASTGLWLAILKFLDYDPLFYASILTLEQALPEIGRFFVGCAPLFIALGLFDLVVFWKVRSKIVSLMITSPANVQVAWITHDHILQVVQDAIMVPLTL